MFSVDSLEKLIVNQKRLVKYLRTASVVAEEKKKIKDLWRSKGSDCNVIFFLMCRDGLKRVLETGMSSVNGF